MFYILSICVLIQFLDLFSTAFVALLKYGNIESIAKIEANPIFRESFIKADNSILMFFEELILKISFGAYLALLILVNKASNKIVNQIYNENSLK